MTMVNRKTASVEDIRKALAPELRARGAIRAVLFGSYARGDADQYSDVDLFIVARSRRPFIERFKDFPGLRRVCPVKSLDLFIYTPDEFEMMQACRNPFVLKALAEGKTIYET